MDKAGWAFVDETVTFAGALAATLADRVRDREHDRLTTEDAAIRDRQMVIDVGRRVFGDPEYEPADKLIWSITQARAAMETYPERCGLA